MSFTFTNTAEGGLEIGGLGVSIVFNNDWTGLTLAAARSERGDVLPH